MVELIHARSGGAMWVDESRLNEYLEAGHKLASSYSPAVDDATEKPEKKRKSRKKEG